MKKDCDCLQKAKQEIIDHVITDQSSKVNGYKMIESY